MSVLEFLPGGPRREARTDFERVDASAVPPKWTGRFYLEKLDASIATIK